VSWIVPAAPSNETDIAMKSFRPSNDVLNQTEATAGSTAESSVVPRGAWARWLTRLALAVLPLVLAVVAYYRAQLAGSPLPRPHGDSGFYAYQLMRAAELHGQWWRVAEDDRLGHPYPTELAKHPGLYEGVDLMLLAALTAGAFGAAWTYHLAVLTVLAVNGWIAAWIVMRSTRSALWAAVAVFLITLNESIAERILGHLHLFKFGWVMLAVLAFVLFLEKPSWRRGVVLGVTMALVLQSSFYLGYFVTLAFGFWYVALAVAGRITRGSVAASVMTVLVFSLVGAALCFPVRTGPSAIVASGPYFQRDWFETWAYGSELWQYLVPRGSWLAKCYYRDVRQRAIPPILAEGWNFPGFTVLFALVVAVVSRFRRSELHRRLGPFVWVGVGLSAVWTVLSLAGGPSALIYYVVPSFRCYGRSGLLVVALGSVLAPIILHNLVSTQRRRLVRAALTLSVLALAASDGWRAARSFPGWNGEQNPPEWVEWLKHQPADVRLAAFTMPDGLAFDWWGLRSLPWLLEHKHGILNGGAFALFEGDLRLLGGSYERINPCGLRFVISLGYESLAFHRDYLATNSWIPALSWLDRVGERGQWQFFRAKPEMPRLPTRSFQKIVARGGIETRPREAPPGCWITGSWPVTEDVIVTEREWAMLGWTDEKGRLLSEPTPALYQHIFGPSVPAYTVRTPVRPGSYRLTVFDRRLNPQATIGYRIVPGVLVSQPEFPARRPGVTVHPVVLPPAPAAGAAASVRVTLVNTSSRYIQTQVFREHVGGVSQTHPGLRSRWPKANTGALVLRFTPMGVVATDSDGAREVPLPEDLPPGGRLDVVVPTDRLPWNWANRPLRVEPSFVGLDTIEAPPAMSELRIAADRPAAELARSRPPHQPPVR
jgi:hypothetical protein